MTEPYLILHKVRGEPVFDVAYILSEEGTDSDPGPWWVTNHGMRAHPYWTKTINDIYYPSEYSDAVYGHDHIGSTVPRMPDDWPDYFQHSIDQTASKSKSPIQSLDVANALASLIKPQAPLVRRKI